MTFYALDGLNLTGSVIVRFYFIAADPGGTFSLVFSCPPPDIPDGSRVIIKGKLVSPSFRQGVSIQGTSVHFDGDIYVQTLMVVGSSTIFSCGSSVPTSLESYNGVLRIAEVRTCETGFFCIH